MLRILDKQTHLIKPGMFGYKAVFNVRVVITYLLYHIEEITQNSHFNSS